VLDFCNPKIKTKPSKIRTLEEGDIFGEIGALLDCARSATVKAVNFAQYGEIDEAGTKKLFDEHMYFAMLLKSRIKTFYRDGLQLFLRLVLRRVNYLAKAPDNLIMDLAFNMKVVILEKGSKLFKLDDRATEMVILAHGILEIEIEVDKQTPLVIEHLTRGSILNP